jgi:hypothetical protein
MRLIESQTRGNDANYCVKFVERTNQENWIRIQNNIGCYSYVGKLKRKGAQTVSLQKGDRTSGTCLVKGVVAHELIHVLGFDHEQCRPDRDNWIDVYYDNIIAGWSVFTKIFVALVFRIFRKRPEKVIFGKFVKILALSNAFNSKI